jgi:glycosyltransferase involved in cell wall biosynthesis
MKKSLNKNIKKFDLVHIHSVFLWPTLIAARIARKHSIPYIISPRGMLVKDLLFKKSFLKKIVWILLFERKNILGASCLHVTSKLEADEIKKFFFIKSRKIINIPNGISKTDQKLDLKEKFEYDERLKKIGDYILYVGRISWKKGLDRLIESMTHIRDINLIIAGNDEENYTKVITKIIQDNRLENRIILWGGVNEMQRSYLMQNAKLFVLTSYSENFGNVILEALLERCPVALTEDVGLYEMIVRAQAGTHLSKLSKKIGEEINFALRIPEHLKSMSKKGYELVSKEFSWSSVAKQMDIAYKAVILSNK